MPPRAISSVMRRSSLAVGLLPAPGLALKIESTAPFWISEVRDTDARDAGRAR